MRKSNIALLNSWGINIKDEPSITDAWLEEMVSKGKAGALAAHNKTSSREHNTALLNTWGVTIPQNATDADIENLVAKGKPQAVTAPAPANVANIDDHPTVKAMKLQMENQRRDTLRTQIDALVAEDRIPANQAEAWLNDAHAATDGPNGNPVIARLRELPARPPGMAPLNIEIGTENLTIVKLDKVVNDLLKPTRNPGSTPSTERRQAIADASKKIAGLINSQRKIERTRENPEGVLAGPLRAAWDAWASGIQNANTMSAGLLRQVILSEIMRAFRRQFASLNVFAHNYKDVALQGTDYVDVPYYPLDTTASTEFKQADGYVIAANAVTSVKSIFVGGIGNGVATPGSGRKYKPLAFTAYEIARQPWLNIYQLIVMAAEQLAIDVRADIINARINRTKFGDAIWVGAFGAFDSNVVAQTLQNAAIKAFWPIGMRNMVLTPDFYTALAADPYVKAFLNIGSTDTIREGYIGGLYGFKETTYDAVLPIANSIQGGDGVLTAGSDPYLAGFIAAPSAVLIATAPVMPGPATMRLLASYEQVTDDQTGLTFSYQYFGDVKGSQDGEIIECAYGSGDGEAAALKRFVTQGL